MRPRRAGIKIPILCHDKKLHPFGGCRMCLVEVEQMKGRLIPACTTPVTEGMIVRTMTDEIVKARKLVLELLLLKHPIDCPVCDAAGDCDLQNLTFEYKVNCQPVHRREVQPRHRLRKPADRARHEPLHPLRQVREDLRRDRFLRRLHLYQPRHRSQDGTEFDGPLNCEFCGSCVSVCPVGALISRPFKFKARWWALNKVKTVCSYCGTGCQLTLGVKDNKVLTTIYDENQGFHNGQLCTRGRFGYQFVNCEKRLTTPLIRKNGTSDGGDLGRGYSPWYRSSRSERGGPAVGCRLWPPRGSPTRSSSCSGSSSASTSAPTTSTTPQATPTRRLPRGRKESLRHHAASPSEIADIQKTNLLLVVKSDAYETHPVLGFEINLGVKRKGVDLRIVSDKKGKLTRLPGAKTYVHKPGSELFSSTPGSGHRR